ncbi:MAG: competence protein ComJ [Usitatibacter sp.]
MTSQVRVEVSFGQLAVFRSELTQPFNDWTDQHVAQGFSWRPGSVSFRSLVESGDHAVEIHVQDHLHALDSATLRAVEVPFNVGPEGGVEVGSVGQTVPLSLPPGSYLLRCEFLKLSQDLQRVRLWFAKGDPPRFAILRADKDLSPGPQLLTTAVPAG